MEAWHRLSTRNSLVLSRTRMRVASILWHREQWGGQRADRYDCFGAGPQSKHTVEVFVSSGRLACRAALGGQRLGQVNPVHMHPRVRPLTIVGQGKAGLEDKIAAHVHQAWHEYGPEPEDGLASTRHVRPAITCVGAEFDVPNCTDIGGHSAWSCKGRTASEVVGRAFLYPRAAQVPGNMHIQE